ncbi:MAG: ProQ/FINO family protein [Rickettsiaceae bacterium]
MNKIKRPTLTLNLNSLSEETKSKIAPVKPLAKTKSSRKKSPADKKNTGPKYKIPREDYLIILKYLQDKLPKLFNIKNPKIFKIGIHNDVYRMLNADNKVIKSQKGELRKDLMSKAKIKNFFAMYCKSPEYKKAHKLNSPRYDLNNQVIDNVNQGQINGIIARTSNP